MSPILRSARLVLVLCAVAGALAGCGEVEESAPANLDPDAPPVLAGDWPRLPTSTTWQWQLKGEVNTGYPVDLYDVDLFDVPAAQIASLKSSGRKVVCYFSAGSSEDWRPDFGRLSSTDLGEPLDDWEGELWLDVRAQNVFDVMLARLDLAREKGCDGVEPDNVDGFANDTGFDLSARDQLAFNRALANAAHARGLAVGLKNDVEQVGELVAYFDFMVSEECHRYAECAALQPFIAAGKPVFNAEYPEGTTPQALAAKVCPAARAADLRTLILPLELDDGFRLSCDELP